MTKWIIPSNPKNFDAVGAFKELKTIDWKQGIQASEGDIIYIYVASPEKALRIKSKVVSVYLSEQEIDDSRFVVDGTPFESYGKYMRLELVQEYENEALNYEQLCAHGLKSVQGPVKVLGELEEYIDSVTASEQEEVSKIISVLDKKEYSAIFEAMNDAFTTDYDGWMKATWRPAENSNFWVWFPKLAILKGGEYKAAANDCVNVLSDDGKRLVYDDLKLTDKEDPPASDKYVLIFAKDPDGPYRFRGVFKRDNTLSKANHTEFYRISTAVKVIGAPAKSIELLDEEKTGTEKPINIPRMPKTIIQKAGEEIVVCPTCEYMFKYAKRCPECGQLIDYSKE